MTPGSSSLEIFPVFESSQILSTFHLAFFIIGRTSGILNTSIWSKENDVSLIQHMRTVIKLA